MRHVWRVLALTGSTLLCGAADVQVFTWEQAREQFLRNNPDLAANRINIEENRANEITAGLLPNPEFAFVADQFRIFNPNPLRPFQNAQWTPTLTQLFERGHKRRYRIESARLGTSMSVTDAQDQERQLLFNLRDAFVRSLQAKSLFELAQQNVKYYGEVVRVNRERLKAGDIASADFQRIELQQAQYESDLVNAQVNLRTSKIALLALMQDSRPVDSIDIAGEFGFRETILLADELHRLALESRPDLLSATTAINKARVDNKLAWANGATDLTAGFEYQRTQPDNTAGLTIAFPLRIFDRNQGEKARTRLEINRVEKVRQSLATSVLRDVDSAWETVESTRRLLHPYRDRYLPEAEKIRETVGFAYQHGGASLLDFLDAQKTYRDTELAYRNLIGSYLTAVNQLNLAVGREVMQ